MIIGICNNIETLEMIKADPFVQSRIGDSPLHEDIEFQGTFYLVGIVDDQAIGYCKCLLKAGVEVEVHPAVRGEFKKYSVEFFNDCMEWIFEAFPMTMRISTQVLDKFPMVKRFVEKRLGFTYEGTMRSAAIRDSGYHDLHVLSILRNEYVGRKGQVG